MWISLLVLVCGRGGEEASVQYYRKPTLTQPLNILMILADDLGYGDTSVFPFVGRGIQTPHLERMASRGVVMSNYHTAAATCTPTRASILTGLYPWRLGIKAVFEYGEKGKSNRDDWLVQVPTAPMIFSEHNYSTFHSGKWHLGGMRNDDYAMRLQPEKGTHVAGGRRCHHPGPIQQGFHNYVSVLDGPGAPRQNELQIPSTLYSEGCNFLLENDKKLEQSKYNISGWLSYCEARHAMRAIDTSVAENKPFYIHLWFHAPHGPWQVIPGYEHLYQEKPDNNNGAQNCNQLSGTGKKMCNTRKNRQRVSAPVNTRLLEYRSMVSDMDAQIGMVLDHLDKLGISKNTLVFFTSDNGPEDFSGTPGTFRGNKRHLYEGGIRVPAIAQWIDTIPAGTVAPTMAISTDLLATFLDAANLVMPSHVHIDGMSFLPELLTATQAPTISNSGDSNEKAIALKTVNHEKKRGSQYHKRKHMLQERVYLWMNDYEGPRRTAAVLYDYKILLDEEELPYEMFDMRLDPNEATNLLANYGKQYWKSFVEKLSHPSTKSTVGNKHNVVVSKGKVGQETGISAKVFGESVGLTRNAIMKQRHNSTIHHVIVERMYKTLLAYAKRADEGYRTYLEQHPGHKYNPSPLSDNRPMRTNIFKKGMTMQKANEIAENLVTKGTCGTTPCSCERKTASVVKPLPFPGLVIEMNGNVITTRVSIPGEEVWWNPVIPQPFLNGSHILGVAQ